jgi:Tn3 transposase DDE domain
VHALSIYFGKSGGIATNNIEDQEIAVLSLHLLQVSLVYINTLMIQQVSISIQYLPLFECIVSRNKINILFITIRYKFILFLENIGAATW